MRYKWLIELVRERQPKRILEIGVAMGNSAEAMMKAAPNAEYYGVDLFEDLTLEVAKAEMNGKKVGTMEQVQQRLGDRARLFKGNTNDILLDLCVEWASKGVFFDLIFIDGGHSIETIEHDFACAMAVLDDDGLIFLDDYYSRDYPDGMGCNVLVESLQKTGKTELQWSDKDSFGSTDIQMVSVRVH